MRTLGRSYPRKARRASFWLLGALFCALGPRVAAQSGPQGEVVGQVLDQRGRPVRAATVMIDRLPLQAATDSSGLFRLHPVPAGRHVLRVTHVAYEPKTAEVEVNAERTSRLTVVVAEIAIPLAPLNVEAMSAEDRRRRGLGVRRHVVTRERIAKAEASNLTFPDLLRIAAPNIQVRRLERVLGSPVCVELRTIRAAQPQCLSPAVYLDGVPVSNPSSLYDDLQLNGIESIEILSAAEAGVMYGTGALYGALLIKTRKPGVLSEEETARALSARRPNFNWNQDASGHRTAKVFVSTLVANATGLALGITAARQCLSLRQPSNDGIISDCNAGLTVASGAAAILLPALGSGMASGWAGSTPQSRGLLAPPTVGSAMTLLPAYALVFSGLRNNSDGLRWAGYGFVLLGPPIVATAADYLFRRLRATPETPH